MMGRAVFIVMCFFIFAGASDVRGAEESPITADFDKRRIDITTGFDGESLVVFGVRRGAGDLEITVLGPERPLRVRKKGRVMGAWVNRDSLRFQSVPSYFGHAVLEGKGVHGIADYTFVHDKTSEEKAKTFKAALVRTKQAAGLYDPKPVMIEAYDQGELFRADFHLPSNVPIGDYKVNIFYNDQVYQHVETKKLSIKKTGMNAAIYNYATKYSFVYGLCCVMVALGAGWISNKLRRRA